MIIKPTRKAILIVCPGKGKTFLRGAYKDVQNVRNFLLSNRAGRWSEDEIHILDNPTCDEAYSFVQSNIADYVLVYFTGHGKTNSRYQKYLALKDGFLLDKDFLNESPRQRIISDSCNKIPLQRISGIPKDERRFLHMDGYYPARILFDEYIIKSPTGKIIIHACLHNTSAYSNQDGSHFTNALLNIAENTLTDNYYPLSENEILYQVASELFAMKVPGESNPQSPEITYEEGDLQIPIAFGFKYPIKNISATIQNRQQKKFAPKETYTAGTLALLGISALLIIAGAIID